MMFLPILDHFWCSVEPFVTFSWHISNFEKNPKNPRKKKYIKKSKDPKISKRPFLSEKKFLKNKNPRNLLKKNPKP